MRAFLFAAIVLASTTARAEQEPEPAAAPASEPAAASASASASAPAPAPVSASVSAPASALGPLAATAPPSAAGGTGLLVKPGMEIFAQYGLRFTETQPGQRTWFHQFDVPRVHGSLTGEYGSASGRLLIEAVRSASEGALLGVAGDSLVLRLREAWAGYQWKTWVSVQAGVIPTFTVPELEGTWRLRVVGPAPLELTGLAAPADLGIKGRLTFPKKYGFVGVGIYNGEGYTSRELNRGKNIEMAASVRPAAGTKAESLAVFGSYVIGSSGTGSARADRLNAALLWQGIRVRAGAGFTYAWGLDNDGSKRSLLVDGFMRLEPVDKLLIGVRGAYWNRNTDSNGDTVTSVTASLGYRWADPLETHLTVSRNAPGEITKAALVGSDFWSLAVVGRVVF